MPIDRERILYLLGEIEKALSILKEFQQEAKERILGDPKSLGAIKYYFIVAIEGCASVGNHVISREHWGIPESYVDTFVILGRKSVVPENLAQNLVNMARFRNLLVHLYWKVNDERLYEILQSHLQDIEEFVDCITRRYL
jgi:uncharacterized protein YutE (UPF0331/DUF86 family)